ncbi:unnamed protein product [Rotaria sp. Silwood1]|nr:unnamed protein product [Rotaria sp. Silwood1]CAF1452213.1 unnamed protein product [Rotaria sp. Silwood1]CAF3559753.1 unnamed protein product [Rotaria sp. Silwood1]CAF3586551.1 unnamed protein product [Rotaria sp. Silwood1]CAF3640814.1 unnamed protein product [Rotaria sp. Silwood1]
MTDENITCQIEPDKTIEDLKKMIQKKKGILADQQRIIFAGKQLEDRATLTHYGIHNGATLHLVPRKRVEAPPTLDLSSLDPQYDYDFSNVQDCDRKFRRGGIDYVRPCGWKRFAIKVTDKYENLIWLGHHNKEGEWPVSYHGTGFNQNKTMATDGYNLTKGKRYAFGHGVYSTPDVSVAEKYAVKFSHEGNQYLVVLQNRVNPEQLVKLPAAETGIGDYWISPSDKDIRPYGILIRKV